MDLPTTVTLGVLGAIFLLLFWQVARMNGGGNTSSIFAQTSQVLLDENRSKSQRITQLEGERDLWKEKAEFYESQLQQVKNGDRPTTEITIDNSTGDNTSVGNVSDATGVAVGRGSSSTVKREGSL